MEQRRRLPTTPRKRLTQTTADLRWIYGATTGRAT
jgi:hypothetical protein